MKSGIYQIVNIKTGQRYIGSSNDVSDRIRDHLVALRNGKHRNQKLQASWAKYGESFFVFKKIIVCRRSDLELYEQAAMDHYGAYYATGGGFNLRPMAFSPQGRKGSEHQKQVTRKRLLGTKNPQLSALLLAPERAEKSRKQLDSFRSDPGIETKRAAAIRAAYVNPEKREQQASFVRGLKRSPETIAKLRITAARNAAKRKSEGYVIPRGPDGRIIPKSALTGQPQQGTA